MKKIMILGAVFFITYAFAIQNGMADEKELMKSCMNNAKTECQKWAVAGGGGEFPRGLSVESRVELAHGERYILKGDIAIFSNLVWLNIDFDEQPWLASGKRRANPFYRIDDDVSRWKKFNGKPVSIIVTAQNVIWATSDNRYSVEIFLVPGSDPLVDVISSQDSLGKISGSCR